MLRRLKTNLTKDDLAKPAIDLGQADQEDSTAATAAGAFLLPEDKTIAKSLSSSTAPSKDWMKVGDPTAPAIKELEMQARQAREQAMAAAAAAQNAMPMALPLGGMAAPAAIPFDVSTQTATSRQPDTGTTQFPWRPGQQPAAAPAVDDVDQFAQDMGVTYHLQGQPSPAVQPIANAPAPATQIPVTIPDEPMVSQAGDEFVLRIPHDPSELLNRPVEKAIPATDNFASGGAVKISHQIPMDSLPYTPAETKKQTHSP